jgi:hypothetical protein
VGAGGATAGQSAVGPIQRSPQPRISAPIDLDPDRLRITDDELKFMQLLRPLLGRSPRALKRFVNCYRLIKAGVATDAQDAFMHGSGADSPCRVVLFLLAIVTGTRSVSRPLFTALAAQSGSEPVTAQPLTTLSAVVDSVRPLADEAEFHSLEGWLQSHERGAWNQVSIQLFKEWAPAVARYSFRVEALA